MVGSQSYLGSILQKKCWVITASVRRSSEHLDTHLALPVGRTSLERGIGSTLPVIQVLPGSPVRPHFQFPVTDDVWNSKGLAATHFHLKDSDFISGWTLRWVPDVGMLLGGGRLQSLIGRSSLGETHLVKAQLVPATSWLSLFLAPMSWAASVARSYRAHCLSPTAIDPADFGLKSWPKISLSLNVCSQWEAVTRTWGNSSRRALWECFVSRWSLSYGVTVASFP